MLPFKTVYLEAVQVLASLTVLDKVICKRLDNTALTAVPLCCILHNDA